MLYCIVLYLILILLYYTYLLFYIILCYYFMLLFISFYSHIYIGNPFDGSFKVNWRAIEELEYCNDFREDTFNYHANLARSVQENLEVVALSLAQSLRTHAPQRETAHQHLVITGGVALNSVMNGKLRAQSGFEEVFVPPAPGDEGIAYGCAMYGLQVLQLQLQATYYYQLEYYIISTNILYQLYYNNYIIATI